MAFQVDQNHGIVTDGLFVSLVRIKLDDTDPGAFITLDEHIFVGIDEERTVAGLERIVTALKTKTAWELLTEHYNTSQTSFFINRPWTYHHGTEDGPHRPKVHDPGGRGGWEY